MTHLDRLVLATKALAIANATIDLILFRGGPFAGSSLTPSRERFVRERRAEVLDRTCEVLGITAEEYELRLLINVTEAGL